MAASKKLNYKKKNLKIKIKIKKRKFSGLPVAHSNWDTSPLEALSLNYPFNTETKYLELKQLLWSGSVSLFHNVPDKWPAGQSSFLLGCNTQATCSLLF